MVGGGDGGSLLRHVVIFSFSQVEEVVTGENILFLSSPQHFSVCLLSVCKAGERRPRSEGCSPHSCSRLRAGAGFVLWQDWCVCPSIVCPTF